MTLWLLECEDCKNIKKLDVAYNLLEFKRLYLYCRRCRRNTFHKVLEFEERDIGSG